MKEFFIIKIKNSKIGVANDRYTQNVIVASHLDY